MPTVHELAAAQSGTALPVSHDPTSARSNAMVPTTEAYHLGVMQSQFTGFPPFERSRSTTLDPSAQMCRIAPPSRVAGAHHDYMRFASPFFCQDCGQPFKVGAVGAYESHRTKCKGKAKREGVEIGDLKAVGRARRNTVNKGLQAGGQLVLNSMPNLHGKLPPKPDVRKQLSPIRPMALPPFQFPVRPVPFNAKLQQPSAESAGPTQADAAGFAPSA
ncbi:hypothetical protein BU23DRAFT_575536 [Bimuria novae-zelandiae CBS 107.79]|uniref:Uncharacterized protein n=1 Tax=Bimuria novae-zelandiae CBS 107.79 TaxID=1447943 RepID=A0A6A5UKZ8_9PLEO|nr:hypothetical protein BU23DRAFT_575536 [Bimuria novae-zelandiae CBS 107.79]